MTRQVWTNRIAPPLVIAAVMSFAWYAVQNRPQPAVAVTATTPTTSGGVVADAEPTATVAPVVQKIGGQVQFSIDTTHYKHVQKVEFYIESQLVGAAYSHPYSVVVDEDNLAAGSHTVTAKVYMSNAAAQTPPASFETTPSKSSNTSVGDETVSSTPPASTPSSPPSTPNPVAAPTDLSATTLDGNVGLGWTASADAASYQVWRDGNQIGTTTNVSYTDNGLTPGQTYDYMVVAVTAVGKTSDPSNTAAVTVPMVNPGFTPENQPDPQQQTPPADPANTATT